MYIFRRYALVLIFIVSVLFSVGICYLIAAMFFFDTFFYEKSITYGYWPIGKQTEMTFFKRRSADILSLERGDLGRDLSSDIFTVAIIGDSYTWGQGVKNSDLFGVVLEKKLNTVKKSKVIILGNPGNSLLDYLTTYENLKKLDIHIDAYVFALVTNDILPFYKGNYVDSAQQVFKRCEFLYGSLIRDIDWSDSTISMEEKLEQSNSLWNRIWASYANRCLLDIFALLPTHNSYYLLTDNYTGSNIAWDVMRKKLIQHGKRVVSSSEMSDQAPYSTYIMNPSKYLEVSVRDNHPSKRAHALYAELLFTYLKPHLETMN